MEKGQGQTNPALPSPSLTHQVTPKHYSYTHFEHSRDADSTTSLGKRVRQCRAWAQHRGASAQKSTVCLATKAKKYPLDQGGGCTETKHGFPLATELSLWAARALHSSQHGLAVGNSRAGVQRAAGNSRDTRGEQEEKRGHQYQAGLRGEDIEQS